MSSVSITDISVGANSITISVANSDPIEATNGTLYLKQGDHAFFAIITGSNQTLSHLLNDYK
jgi:hypothetical protein